MEVPASATTDQRELRSAINNISLSTSVSSDLSQALALASALVSREEQSEVAIISDGNVIIPDDIEVPATVRYFPIGRSQNNTAISALALQPGTAGQTLFVQATNYDENAPAERRLDVFLDGSLFNAYDLALEPGGERSIVAEVPPQVSVVEARLSGDDALALDNQAWAVSSLGETTRVRLVSPGNRFLETALTLLPSIDVTTVPTATARFEETAAQIPVTILDGVVPRTLPPGNLLFIAPPRSTEFFSVTGTLDFPSIRPAPGDDSLLRNVSLSELSVLEAVRIVPGTWARVVVDSDGAPLLVAGERNGRRVVVLAFDLHLSDLPLQVAFPLLLSNMINFLAPESGSAASQLVPGEPLALRIDPAITEVRLTLPDGTQLGSAGGVLQGEAALQIQNDQVIYADTSTPGVYVLEEFREGNLEARHRYAVNLFAPDESRIAPQSDLEVPQVSGLQSAVTEERVGRQEIWRWLAALALLVLVVEWLVYQRNGIAYLRERWRARRQQKAAPRSR
jgi:archaellum component FlaG (FlaF/FlaG flagellin family)